MKVFMKRKHPFHEIDIYPTKCELCGYKEKSLDNLEIHLVNCMTVVIVRKDLKPWIA